MMKEIPTGELNKRIAIQAPSDTRSTSGAVVTGWSSLCYRWAKVEPLTGREVERAKLLAAETDYKVTLKYYSGLNTENRFLFGTTTLEILAVIDLEEAHKYMEVLCKRV